MRWTQCLIILFAIIPLSGTADEAENVRVVRAMTEAINNRKLDALDDLVASNVLRHSAATPGVVVTNLEEFRTFLMADFAAVPDSIMEIEIIFGSGDYVAVRAKYRGTQTGPMGPFPASGKQVDLPYMGILRLEEGKIAEIWVEWDNLHILKQLGHFPEPYQ